MKGKFFKAQFLYRLRYILLFIKNGFKSKTVCFYPQYPHKKTIMFKTGEFLGLNMISNINRKADSYINWENTTFRTDFPALKEIDKKQKVLNLHCKDISKVKVDDVFYKIFQYRLIIDPLTFKGKCVKKSNMNAKKDGHIINCPIQNKDKNYVYLKIIDNSLNEDLVQDIRTPVIKGIIPYVYLRRKLKRNRFINTNDHVIIEKPENIFSKKEIKKIQEFTKAMDLDLGELDILRDNNDNKIYIVDVNNTPWGPPNHLDNNEWKRVLNISANMFKEIFLLK